jgi:hypothetical protein
VGSPLARLAVRLQTIIAGAFQRVATVRGPTG